jgi:hypothetical protein
MARAPGEAISIEESSDVLFILDKSEGGWQGCFRFGGLGLLPEVESEMKGDPKEV